MRFRCRHKPLRFFKTLLGRSRVTIVIVLALSALLLPIGDGPAAQPIPTGSISVAAGSDVEAPRGGAAYGEPTFLSFGSYSLTPVIVNFTTAGGQGMVAPFAGFALGFSLIFSLGPQNLTLIRAGITRSHPLFVASTGFVSEIALVSLGIGGLGTTIGQHPSISSALELSAVGFLIWCGMRSLARCFAAPVGDAHGGMHQPRLRAVSAMLVVTWFNPLVWLEAVFLVGVLASGYGSGAQPSFAAGFLAASAVKFYGWGLIGMSLSDLMKRPSFRRHLDAVSGVALLLAAGFLSVH